MIKHLQDLNALADDNHEVPLALVSLTTGQVDDLVAAGYVQLNGRHTLTITRSGLRQLDPGLGFMAVVQAFLTGGHTTRIAADDPGFCGLEGTGYLTELTGTAEGHYAVADITPKEAIVGVYNSNGDMVRMYAMQVQDREVL